MEATRSNIKIFFRKCLEKGSSEIPSSQNPEDVELSTPSTFLFVHQTQEQQHLLNRYGHMVLLDATYKTSKYALPLFMLAVSTNFKYMPVAEFIVESESTENIAEALKIVKVSGLSKQVKKSLLQLSVLIRNNILSKFIKLMMIVNTLKCAFLVDRWCNRGINVNLNF